MESYDATRFPPEATPCPRCGSTAPMRFAGPCADCIDTLRTTMRNEAVAVDAEYVPKVNVTANAVALKDD
jgi:hypothetical protein